MQSLTNKYTLRGKVYEKDQTRAAAVLLIPTSGPALLFVVPAVQVVYYSFTNFNLTLAKPPSTGSPTSSTS